MVLRYTKSEKIELGPGDLLVQDSGREFTGLWGLGGNAVGGSCSEVGSTWPSLVYRASRI